MVELKKRVELILTFIFAVLGEPMAWLDLEWLQMLYYILAAVLMVIAIWKLLTNRKLDVEKLSQPASIVDQAHNPKRRGESILKTIRATKKLIKKGGKKVKDFFKNSGWVKSLSLILTIILLILGILSAFVQELAVIGQNLELYVAALGIAAVPGIFAKGRVVGETVKSLLPAKERRKIKAEIKAWSKKLDELVKKYADVIATAQDIHDLGGQLTPDQETQYNTYKTQEKTIKAKIDELTRKLEVPNE